MSFMANYVFPLFTGMVLLMLPFQVWNGVFAPTVTGKILFASCASIFLLFTGRFSLFFNKGKKITITLVDVLCIIYVLFFLLSVYVIRPTTLEPLKILEYTSPVVFYAIFRTLNSRALAFVGISIILATMLQSVYGILQQGNLFASHHAQFKITGSFFNPAPYAGYIACMLPVLVGIFCIIKKKITRLLLLVVAAVIFTALIASGSRGALMGAVAGTTWLLWKQHHVSLYAWLLRNKKAAVILISIGFILSICGGTALYLTKKPSADGRVIIWKNTCSMIADHPLRGVGVGQFKAHYMNYQADYFESTLPRSVNKPADNSIYAFNEFLETASEQGIIGLLLLLALFAGGFITRDATRQRQTDLACSGLLCILVFACFSYPFDVLPIKINTAFFLAVISSGQKPLHMAKNRLVGSVILLFCCILPVFTVRHIWSTAETYAVWKEAFHDFRPNRQEYSLNLCADIVPDLQNNGVFLSMYGKMLTVTGHPEQAIAILEEAARQQPGSTVYMDLGDNYKKLKCFTRAEQAYKKAWMMIPSRIKPCYMLAKLYMEAGKNDKAVAMIKETLSRWEKQQHTKDSYAIKLEMEALLCKIEKKSL